MCAWVAAVCNALSALQNYALLAKIGSGDFYALQGGKASNNPLVRFFELVLKQDFFLFLVLCLALGGVLLGRSQGRAKVRDAAAELVEPA